MAAFKPKELLDYLLEDEELSPAQLEAFIQANYEEKQYFDYKNGVITTPSKRNEGRQTIREYVSGFANSDGGVLLVGVDENNPRQVAPCEPSIGGLPLDQWASRCLQDMTGYFSPQPRFQVIPHPQGHVLAISVARAPSLVPCVESRTMKYFLRIGDSTLQVPEYLIADLVMGRRQHPFLNMYARPIQENAVDLNSIIEGRESLKARSVMFVFEVENLSLATAEDINLGIVLWSLVNGPHEDINRHLRSYLDIEDINPNDFFASKFCLIHRTSAIIGETYTLTPFQKQTIRIGSPFYFPLSTPTIALGGIYILSRSAPPVWFQIRYTYGSGIEGNIEINRQGTGRPEVAIRHPPILRSF